MKKAGLIVGIALLLAIVGGVLWYIFLRPTPVYRAEEIVPSTTIALVQFSNVDEARLKWDQTPLGKIFQEPEVQAFWQQPARTIRQKLDAQPGVRDAEPCFAAFRKVFANFHGEAFVAFLGYDLTPNLSLHLLAGFDAGKQTREAEASVEEMAAEFRSRFPKGVREEKSHLGVPYQAWSPASGLVVCHARLGNFFLFSTDEISLQTAIELAKKNRDNSLKNDPIFQKSLAQVDAQRDCLVYFNPGQVFGKLMPLLATIPQAGGGMKDLLAVKAAIVSCKFEPTGPVDKAFVLIPEAERPPSLRITTPWARKSLPLVSSKALFYGVTCFDVGKYWDQMFASATETPAPQINKALAEFTQFLEMQNIRLRPDLIDKLGSEFALQVNWGERDPLPQVFALIESKDGSGLVAALDRFLTLMSAAAPGARPAAAPPAGPNMLEVEGKTIHWISFDAEKGIGIYYVHLEPFVVFGFMGSDMTAYVNAVAKKQFEGFDANAVYKSAAASMPPSVNSFLYLDNKPLFEKVYNLAAPLAMLGASYLPQQTAVDLSKLPKTATISQHLTPSLSYQYFNAEGFHRYAAGPVPPEAPFVALGATASVVLPAYMESQKRALAAAQPPPPSPRPPGAPQAGQPAPVPATNSAPPTASGATNAPSVGP